MPSTECLVCGNEIEAGQAVCPFCGANVRHTHSAPARERYRTVNLKHDMPTVEQCRFRLDHELARAKRDGVLALKLIHGYGASGVGGDLRYAVRDALDHVASIGDVALVIPGEDLPAHRGRLIRRVPALKEDFDLRRPNAGVTLVLMR